MTRVVSTTGRWPGFDTALPDRLIDAACTPEGERFRRRLDDAFLITDDRGITMGPPQVVRSDRVEAIRRFASAYTRCLERVVDASRTDAAIHDVLRLPEPLRRELDPTDDPLDGRIHLYRLDLLLSPDGEFQVLENNANCPGGIIYTGIAARAWREFVANGSDGADGALALPSPLPHEDPAWMARWFLEAAERDLAGRPDGFVALLHEEGGNSIELPEYVQQFAALGVEAVMADPRELEDPGDGPPLLRGRPLRHAYLKLGLQPFLRMRQELDVMVRTIRERRLFVQNGLRGRWVGDSKLCLAVLSDPDFAHLFDPDDLALVAPHIPWSRSAARLPNDRLDEIFARPEDYVLKRGLDTRGRGVVVGRSVQPDEWEDAVGVARRDGWLVQSFCETTLTRADFDNPRVQRHDLAVGIVDGEVGALFMRSSGEYKVNVAQNGRLHPVFVDG